VLQRVGGAVVLGVLVLSASAWAEPVRFAHGTIDQQFTTTQPGAPSGLTFKGTYHAAGNEQGDPPYMRKMVFYPPPGARYDTGVPDRCTASDMEIETQGPSACPAGSALGKGTSSGRVGGGAFSGDLDTFLFNNNNEQIIVGQTPLLWTVARGRMLPDGSIEFAFPTCFPSADPPGCPVDDVLQLGSTMNAPPYTKGAGSYLTTPPSCPASGHWETPVRYWWADGSVDTAVTTQPCAAPAAKHSARRAHRRRHKRHHRPSP
jgi:hypothetical protein